MDMEADSNPLLARLIDHTNPPLPGRDDFTTALQRLKINSVFDIVRLSEAEFAKQLTTCSDEDAHAVYLKAQSAAAQLERLFRERQVASDGPPQQEKRSISPAKSGTGTTYHAQFNENWDQFCSSNSIAAIDSPAAYLRALYLFVQRLEQNALGSDAFKLTVRRPDLKGLLIDLHTVSDPLPMLSIVNQVLLKNIAGTKPKDIYTLLSKTWYPYSLPLHFYHLQCRRGLSGKKPDLGELNYRISRTVPVTGNADAYGQVITQNDEVQCLLSGLSPEQQILLKSPLVTASSKDVQKFYNTYYQWKGAVPVTPSDAGGPEQVADFLRHTQLDAEQLQSLLAQQTYAPRKSPHCAQDTGLTYGACYVNGLGTHAIRLDGNTPGKLLNVSPERFDRLQRMIRLQRWLDIPFAHLDTLIVSAMRCEGSANVSLLINHNTLRALGVYRYLNKRYGLQAEECAALLYQLPVHASGARASLFDQVFNPTGSPLSPLRLDNKAFDTTTRQQLCAAFDLQNTPDSLELLVSPNASATCNIATASSIYRHARIARLFGLSVMECQHLVDLLGHRPQLLNPTLRSEPQGPADFLDALMHLDWASQWLKAHGGCPSLLRRQLLLDPPGMDATVSGVMKIFSKYDQASLSTKLKNLVLPQQSDDETPKLARVDWESAAHQVLPLACSMGSVEAALDKTLASIRVSVQANRQEPFIQQARTALLRVLDDVKNELWKLYIDLETFIKALPQASGNSDIFQTYRLRHQYLCLYTPPTQPGPTLKTLSYLILLLPRAADLLQLPISQQALHQFLGNPHWLDQAHPVYSQLKLSFSNLYLMQRFRHCIDHYGLSEERLFNYFEQANSASNGAAMGTSEKTDEQLARLLGWSLKEIEVLSSPLTPPRITSMERLDWVMRCHQASTDTRLPISVLINASQLNSTSTFEAWKAVGESLTTPYQ